MIFRNGGTVDYDMPVAGPAYGSISPVTNWYVIGDARANGTLLPAPFLKAQAKAARQARLAGIRPMPLERLLIRINGG
jgi:hypothetical protein